MKLEELLSQKGLVMQSPNAEKIRERARIMPSIKLFYGETYDSYGNTIDSMKYYFFVSNLAESLRKEGFETESIILVADTAACRNVSSRFKSRYINLGRERANFIENINKIYNTGLEILKMSSYVNSPEFQKELQRVVSICKSDIGLMKKVEKTVPQSKIEIERKKRFMYSFDEITTIMNFDIKIGPPREDLYDDIARAVAERDDIHPLMSLFLTPTFPLGKNWAYFFVGEGIEEHGITAYKGGSKRLQNHRVLVGRTTVEYAKELINSSFISTNSELPNPILDIGIICEMAKKRLFNDNTPITLTEEFYSGKVNPNKLKEKVSKNLELYILSKF